MPVDLLANPPSRKQPRDLLARQPQHPEFDASTLAAPQREPSRAVAGLTSAVEGIPVVGPYLGSATENVAAGIGSLMTGRPRPEVRQEMGQMVDEAQEAFPGTSTAAGIGGAVLGTAPLVMAAPGAFGAGAGPLGASLAGRMGMGAASGAALGGADAAVRSGGDPSSTLQGAGWGAGLGGAGTLAGAAAGRGAGAIARRIRGPNAAQRAFGRAASADAVDDVGGRLAAMGDDAMPMDLGPNLQRQAGALAATPGRGQEIVRSAISGRQTQAGQRVMGALDDALGQSTDTIALADDIIARRAAAAKPLYDAAYSKPVPYTQELETILKRPSVGRALSKARGLAADEGIPSQQWFANIADDGTVTIKNVPDVRQLDLTKRALDDMISAAQRAGNNNEARILTQNKNQLLSMIDEAVPEYAQARAAFSGPTAVLDAMEEGQKAFSNTLTPNQMRTRLMKMGDAEKEAYIQGARSQIADMMGTARNDAAKVRGEFQKGYNREKLELLIGKEQSQRLLGSLDAETAFAETRNVVTGNSETAARVAARADVGLGSKEPGILRSIDLARPLETVSRVGERITGGARSAMQSKANEELSRLLTARDPQSATRAIRMVQAAQRRGDISAQKAKQLIQSMTVGASVGALQKSP